MPVPSHTQKNRHRPRFTFISMCSCWSLAGPSLVALLGQVQLPHVPLPWPPGSWGEMYSLCLLVYSAALGAVSMAKGCRESLKGWIQWSWKDNSQISISAETLCQAKWVHSAVWSAESKTTASEPWWTNEDSFAGSVWSDCLAHPASWSAQPCCTSISVVHTVDELLQFIALHILE